MASPKKPPATPKKEYEPQFSDEVKQFIVREFAAFAKPKEVVAALKENFDIDTTKLRLRRYDLGAAYGRRDDSRLSQELQIIFQEAREAYLDEVARIPIANRAYRLAQLNRVVDEEWEKSAAERDPNVIAKALEQAAKEVGNVYTNSVSVRGTFSPETAVSVDQMAIEERRNMLVDRLSEAFGRMKPARVIEVKNAGS